LELFVKSSSPGGVGVAVDVTKDVGEIIGLLRVDEVCYFVCFAELDIWELALGLKKCVKSA
jgi:hypothetical protein